MQSLQEFLMYGLKGMFAYAAHTRRLGKTDDNVSEFIEDGLFATMTNGNFDMRSLLEMALECGRQNIRVMEMLDDGYIENSVRRSRRPSTKARAKTPAFW